MDIDGSLVDSFAREIMWRKNMLGVMTFWFPLAADQQDKYTFKLEAEERYQDLDVYRISYRQNDGEEDAEDRLLVLEQDRQESVRHQLGVHIIAPPAT